MSNKTIVTSHARVLSQPIHKSASSCRYIVEPGTLSRLEGEGSPSNAIFATAQLLPYT
jgi:hypothetical protein